MNFIVIDLEWNQSVNSNLPVNRQGVTLMFEIIQIGAVKVSADMKVLDTYCKFVKPKYFKQMHYKVHELTGFNETDVAKGRSFDVVLAEFLDWCTSDHVLLSWGNDDIRVLQQNLNFYDIPVALNTSYNLQTMFNYHYGLDKTQKSLQNAIAYAGIEHDMPFHDALNDALYSAKIFMQLDVQPCLEHLREQAELADIERKKLIEQLNRKQITVSSLGVAFCSKDVSTFYCPLCSSPLTGHVNWSRHTRYNYFSQMKCSEHGVFCARLRITYLPGGRKRINKSIDPNQ